MSKFLVLLLVSVLTIGCASAGSGRAGSEPEIAAATTVDGVGYPNGGSYGPCFELLETAPVAGYGYSPETPIGVGGVPEDVGSHNEKLYLNALLGPEGQPIRYERRGSCCYFDTASSPTGGGLLDVYEVTWDGAGEPIVLYLDMYDSDSKLYIPVNLTARSAPKP